MTSINDLLDTLDRQAAHAPAADGLIEGAYAGAARIHRRRKLTATLAAAAAVVAVAAGIPAVRHFQAAPPPPAAVTHRTAGQLTVELTPGAGFRVISVQSTAQRQRLGVARDGSALTWSVSVYEPGEFDPSTMPAGEPVRIGDHDARVMPDLLQEVLDDIDQTHALAGKQRALAWQNADGSWVTVETGGTTEEDRATLFALGAAVRTRTPVAPSGPLQLARLPEGYAPMRVTVGADPLRIQTLLLGPPGTIESAPPGSPSIISFRIYPKDPEGATLILPAETKGAPTGTVEGLPAWYVVDDGKEPVLWVRGATCWFTVGADNVASLPAEQSLALFSGATFGSCDSREDWGPMTP
ncbi:hypothetical protein [Actinoplanes sp. RD1]|uniref:hypothetical protein n=1 Tax=Actinoplanes sp. RD1 TaxID=3064538 RepID=UPI002741AB02|nr:hypothetical protein [Actinoplanes sp. RD1]